MEDGLVVSKSSRHSKITGDFAERLILYWLSKYGCECLLVDHVAIDIIARTPPPFKRIGISVKSRSRNTGKEGISIKIPREHLNELKRQCVIFDCIPHIAIVADEADAITGFLLTVEHLLHIQASQAGDISWRMTPAWISRYESDPKIRTFRLTTKTNNWWKNNAALGNSAESLTT